MLLYYIIAMEINNKQCLIYNKEFKYNKELIDHKNQKAICIIYIVI